MQVFYFLLHAKLFLICMICIRRSCFSCIFFSLFCFAFPRQLMAADIYLLGLKDKFLSSDDSFSSGVTVSSHERGSLKVRQCWWREWGWKCKTISKTCFFFPSFIVDSCSSRASSKSKAFNSTRHGTGLRTSTRFHSITLARAIGLFCGEKSNFLSQSVWSSAKPLWSIERQMSAPDGRVVIPGAAPGLARTTGWQRARAAAAAPRVPAAETQCDKRN